MEEIKGVIPREMEQLKPTEMIKESSKMFIAFFIGIIIILVAAAVLYTWALSFIRSDKQYPKVTGECYQSANGDYVINVTELDPDAVCVLRVSYIIVDDHGKALPGAQGSVRDIYGVDLSFQGSSDLKSTGYRRGNESFVDNDADGNISPGDQFVVRSAENGGVAVEGYEFILEFDVSGDKMTRITFEDRRQWSGAIEQSLLQTISLDNDNISLETGTGVLDRFRYYISGSVRYSYSFAYVGEETRNITVCLLLDDKPIHNDTKCVTTDELLSLCGNLTIKVTNYWGAVVINNITVRVSDTESNVTLFHGFSEYQVAGSGCGDPSFLHTPLLQFVTVVILVTMFFVPHRKRPRL